MKQLVRPLNAVPPFVIVLLFVSVLLQFSYAFRPAASFTPQALPQPPDINLLKISSFGDEIVTAKLLMLWLQSFNAQKGRFLVNQSLNYDTLLAWLTIILDLDASASYPLFSASHLYTDVADPHKQRRMLEFVYTQFFVNPAQRWRWLAYVTVIAKHRLKELPLALKYAQAISRYVDVNTPQWTREMEVFILEDMGEWEKAYTVIERLFAQHELVEPADVQFFQHELHELEIKIQRKKIGVSNEQ
ncbi:hypothetical protein [Beggiatoa leptomitoformis]|uniref:Uncharacterized protein n=1 Tax=Beggiatoa leptomitoformis TaxID=288004 RepID=A0A2N9YCK6_9GAMM|nr:hypothetical protein [Beggiatoa leptomitoformis]ALG66521.1 hypothetical protein AL038_00685 [Beggiatoa leptomitoformis]AUI68182.1 hypothetical protein BLE401_05360 [Beggiatoa leptomitoformis]